MRRRTKRGKESRASFRSVLMMQVHVLDVHWTLVVRVPWSCAYMSTGHLVRDTAHLSITVLRIFFVKADLAADDESKSTRGM
jgi:hypothetical protein